MGNGGLHVHNVCRYAVLSLEDFGLQTEESYAMKIVCRTVVGASILGLTASLRTGAFAHGPAKYDLDVVKPDGRAVQCSA
jgi:hypothetical protein